MADEKESALGGPVVEFIDDAVLGGTIEIDHHIAAKDQVKGALEVEGLHQVAGTEHHFLTDLLADLEGAVGAGDQVLGAPAGGKAAKLLVGVDPLLGLGEHPHGDIGCQDGGIPPALAGAEVLVDEHGDIISLLSGGTACAPNAELVIPAGLLKEGEDLLLQKDEVLLFPHKEGKVGGKLIKHSGHLVAALVAFHQVQVLLEAVAAPLAQLVGEAAFNQHPLFGEVDAIFGFDKGGKVLKFLVSNPNHSRWRGVFHGHRGSLLPCDGILLFYTEVTDFPCGLR